MNRIFRVVWSHARQAFIVAHEHASARGKPSSSSKPLGLAVATALLALSGGPANAADICGAGTTTYSGSTTADTCSLASAEGLLNQGTISPAGSSNVTAVGAVGGSLGISNTGTISTFAAANSNTAISNSSGTVGGITNAATGLIFGGTSAIATGANSALPFVRNQGRIEGLQLGAFTTGAFGGNAVFGDLTNSGTIVGEGSGNSSGISIENGATFAGSILNEATGLIQGGNTGIGLTSGVLGTSTVNGSIMNAGVILASTASGTALRFLNASGTLDVTNTGTVGGGSSGYGILLAATLTGGITNSGTISGGLASIQNSGAGLLTGGIRILGNNTAKFIGLVTSAGTTVNVDSGAVYTMDDGQRFSLGSATFTNAGTVGVVATGTGTVTGNYTQDASAVFRVPANSGTAFGKLTVSGTATLPGGALFDVVTGDATNCGGITAGTTLAAVIKAGTLSSTTYGTVTDDCTNLDFTAVTSGNQLNLIAQALGPTWSISGASGSNGTLSCASPVSDGGIATCTGTPSAGYTLSGATGSGTACGTVSVSGDTVTSGPVTGDCTITASFAPIPWTISGASGGNGTLSCASPVTTGGTASCTATGSPGYTLSGATASGTGCGTVSVSGNTVTSGTITGDCTITASFGLAPTWTVSGASNGNGALSCTSPITDGNTTTCTGTPAAGFALSSATGSGTACGTVSVSGNTVTAGPITGPCTITASYAVQGPPEPVPTLSQWGIIFLSSLLALFGIRRGTRSARPGS